MKFIPIILLAFASSVFADANTIVGASTNRQYESDVIRLEFSKELNPKPLVSLTQSLRPKITVELEDTTSDVSFIDLQTMRNVLAVDITPKAVTVSIEEYVSHVIRIVGNVILISIKIAPETPPPVEPPPERKVVSGGYSVSPSLSSESIMKVANALFANGVYDDVIMNLNELLMLPEDANTQKGQELLCQTYEKMGKLDRAKAEYQAYIAKYPDSPNTKMMRQRLIALEIETPSVALRGVTFRVKEGKEHVTSASISDYYYIGTNTPTLTGWKTDQKINIVNFRVTEMYRDEQYTTKIMFRHSRLYDLLRDNRDTHMTQLASLEFTDAKVGYSLKGGRQMPVSGVVGRFDGLSGKYVLSDGFKVVGAVGDPYVGKTDTKRIFYGGGLEYTTENNVIMTGYMNFQFADGIAERRAFGYDIRVASNGSSFFGAIEYDTIYKKFNAITAQTTIKITDGMDLYGIYDRRKFPVLMGDKALVLGFTRTDGRAFKSFGDAVMNSNLSMSDIYRFIDKTSPYGNVMVLGVNKTLTENWSAYLDMQISNITSTTDPTYIPTLDNPVSPFSSPGTGDTYSNNLNFFGNNVISKNDMHNIMLGRTSDKQSTGYSVAILNGKQFEDFRVDISNRYMSRTSKNVTTDIFTSSIRGNIKIGKETSFEAQIAVARTKVGESSAGYSKSFYIGVRHDF